MPSSRLKNKMNECNHKNIESSYGFARSFEMRGLGIYEFCVDCSKLISHQSDRSTNTKEEIEHNESVKTDLGISGVEPFEKET